MKLIIVESPTKARTLTRFLQGEYRVEATMGHIRDLPKSTLGVDIDHDFEPKYIIPKDKQKRVTELKDIAKKADTVILATDPDREGEAIAWHIAYILTEASQASKSKRQKKENEPKIPSLFSRIVFHEITEHAIKDALLHPHTINVPLVNAQQARRVLDRLVGYKLSPLLWQKLSRRWLSAGRVQSVSVRLIVEREREIERFQKNEYWTIDGMFAAGNKQLTARLVSHDSVKYEQQLSYTLFDGKYTTTTSTIQTEEEAKKIVVDLKSPFTVSSVDTKEVRRYPAAPFTTSTLQQDAGRRMYFSAKKTMQLAQKLYEEGLITYHRTDSVNLSEKFITEARAYIESAYGATYIPSDPKRYQTKSKVAQEAHEAIRPTNVAVHGSELASHSELNRDHVRLYEAIWKRAVASQASEAVFQSTTVKITSANTYEFQLQGSIIQFEGYLKITGYEEDAQDSIPPIKQGDVVPLHHTNIEKHETAPPPRYTEATLVKALEEKGIGRPSTYAPIISTIQDRQYVIREDKKLKPTELGVSVTDFLVKYFADIMELPFTATLEDKLDAIANGQTTWQPVISEFYTSFAKELEETYKEAEKVAMPVERVGENCPECGNALVIRTGRYGKFIACSTFPTCHYTRQLVEKIDMKCPKCGGDIIVKKSRMGKTFYGCSTYPACTFAAWKKEDIKPESTNPVPATETK